MRRLRVRAVQPLAGNAQSASGPHHPLGRSFDAGRRYRPCRCNATAIATAARATSRTPRLPARTGLTRLSVTAPRTAEAVSVATSEICKKVAVSTPEPRRHRVEDLVSFSGSHRCRCAVSTRNARS